MEEVKGGGDIELRMTLGSLFDGSGGFPLAGQLAGITPVWASEIEPFPIRVTRKHFPNMKHLGDIRNLNGAEVEPVDIITAGSPCQNMSVAGTREGLDGKASGLFFEFIRIVREMREATEGKYPGVLIWENVPGALTSNKGADFHRILTELCKLGEREFHVAGRTRWKKSGSIMGDSFNLAWRTLNAKYWGVPANRERVFIAECFRTYGGGA